MSLAAVPDGPVSPHEGRELVAAPVFTSEETLAGLAPRVGRGTAAKGSSQLRAELAWYPGFIQEGMPVLAVCWALRLLRVCTCFSGTPQPVTATSIMVVVALWVCRVPAKGSTPLRQERRAGSVWFSLMWRHTGMGPGGPPEKP